MKGIGLEPARALLENLTLSELSSLARQGRLGADLPRSRDGLVSSFTRHLNLDELVEELRALFRGRQTATRAGIRLDRLAPRHGAATVRAHSRSRPQLGHILLARNRDCMVLTCNSTPLFLENRWPVLVRDAGILPGARLFSAFVRPGKIHPSAEAQSPRTRSFTLDEGEYQLRNGRLRLELAHAGPISFQTTFLRGRPGSGRAEYLLEPIV